MSEKFLHKALLENLIFVNKICEKENIKYMSIGGTYFSAVDIQDFYEFDDDIDLIMHYKDIIKIKESITKKHHEVIVPGEKDNHVFLAKFFNYKVTLIELHQEFRKRPGAFIDLSP